MDTHILSCTHFLLWRYRPEQGSHWSLWMNSLMQCWISVEGIKSHHHCTNTHKRAHACTYKHIYIHKNMHTFRHVPFMGDSMWCMALGNNSPESVALKEPHCSWDRGCADFWDTETPYQACSRVTCHMTDGATAFYRLEGKGKMRGSSVTSSHAVSQSHSCQAADVTFFSKLKLQFQVLIVCMEKIFPLT